MDKDVVAQLPSELAEIKGFTGKLPDGVEFEPGYYCRWNDRFFIHTRATLPLKDIRGGVGFGLWVEVSKEDFDRYLSTENNDKECLDFKTRGKLANSWPGFENMMGVEVTVKAISVSEKVYITEVHIDKPRDPLFEVALLTQKDDAVTIEKIRNLVRAYILDAEAGP